MSKTRYNFKYSMHGYGDNIKEALRDALRASLDATYDFNVSDWKSIELHEVVSIEDESDD